MVRYAMPKIPEYSKKPFIPYPSSMNSLMNSRSKESYPSSLLTILAYIFQIANQTRLYRWTSMDTEGFGSQFEKYIPKLSGVKKSETLLIEDSC